MPAVLSQVCPVCPRGAASLRSSRTALPGRVSRVLAVLIALAFVLDGLSGCGGSPTAISLPAATVQQGAVYQSGQPSSVTFNTGGQVTPTPGNLSVTFTPTAASSGASAFTVNPTGLDALGGNSYVVRFNIPTLSISAPTSYGVVLRGGGSLTPFTTSPPLVVTVQPVAALLSAAPASAAQGATVDVTLTGVGTAFASGTTASFGAGITVGGAAAGATGPVQVTSATTAIAHLVLSATAAIGTRDISITTGSQTLTLAGGFSTTAATPKSVPPLANAGGPYTGTAGKPVSFSGAGSSDPQGRALTYAWNFGDNSNGAGLAPTHTYASAGTYNAVLTVTNTDGLSATATAPVTVVASAQPPVANAGGPYQGTAGVSVAFNGSASTDPNSKTLTYAWNFGDGGSATGVAPAHTYATPGTYAVTLAVTNTDGLSASATAAVVIAAAAPQSPVANAGGPYTGTTVAAVSLNGSASSDPKGRVLTFAWNFGDGSVGTGASPSHTYITAGMYTATLTVTNTDNLSNSAAAAVTITAPPGQPPVANAGGPYTGAPSQSVTFNGSGSRDPQGKTLTYAWSFGDGGTSIGVSPSHTYTATGTYTVTLTVTNTDGLTNAATSTATITAASQPQPPVANAGGPYTGAPSQSVVFNGTASSDPKGESLTYAWNFGDGGTGSGVSPAHAYTTAGTYMVTLTVTNTDNLTATATASATIAAASQPQPPVANAGGPYTGTANQNVLFSGAASSNPNGGALTYAWNFGDSSLGNGATPSHAYAAAGTYTVTLTVTNNDNLTASATTSATITGASQPQPPVANAGGPYTGATSAAIPFSGAASTDPKGESLSYQWTFGDGGTGTGVSPTHAYVDAGTYSVTLTVTNTDGLNATATTTAIITAPGSQQPVANAGGPYTGLTSNSVRFDGTASTDPANSPGGYATLTFRWNFGDGGQGAGPSPTHTYTAAGNYTVTLTVANSAGGSATASGTATINQGPPVANLPNVKPGGPYSGARNTAIAFSGAGSSDPQGVPLTYSWDFGDGSSADGVSVSHTYTRAGTYSVVLTASNNTSTSTGSTTATVTAPATQAVQASAGGPYTIAVNQPLTLDGSATTNPNTRQLLYTWNFGDGTTGSGVKPIHFYAVSGTYAATVTASDGVVASSTATASVSVTGPASEAIVASAGGPYLDSTGRDVVFDATASTDNLGNALTYSWDFGDGATGTGATPTHNYAVAGNYTVKVTVSSGSVSAVASAMANIANALTVTVTTPTANTLFSASTVTVTGTVSAPNLSVKVNGTAATVSGTAFTANNVPLREGVNLLTATATDSNGGVGTGAVSVILDVTAPRVSITSPGSGAALTTTQTAVAGLVNDSVTGTIGSNDVTVTVNGIAAQVSNRSYLLPNLQLVPGSNTITVVVRDRVGNTSQASETVQVVPPASQLSLVKLSGDNQSGATRSVLTQPLVVQLVAANGIPVAGRPVTFTVTRSDGNVEVMPTVAQTLYVTTDAAGKASVLFKLGTRSGLGVNQVTATTPGASGGAVFTASSTTGAATQIHVVRGETQRGLLGAPLAEAFQVIVQDAFGNPVPGVTVNYTVSAGDGTFAQPTVTTDSNGKASSTLTLGQQEGVNNYTAQVNFTGNAGLPVTFTASGYAAGPVANTSVSGVVLDNANVPVVNATVKLLGTSLMTVTDASGRFKLTGAPVGTVTLSVDGSTSTSTDTLPFLSFVLQDLPGQDNTIGKPVYLPKIDINNAQTVGGDDPVTLTVTGVPGVGFTIAPHSVTFPDGTNVGKMSLSLVKSDMVPMEPTSGTAPDMVWTLQPAGTRFSVPVQITLPNTQALPPGYVSEMYQYDHDLEQFVSIGTGHVSPDGSVMVSDAGFGITKAGWGHGAVTPVPGQCTQSCGLRINECVTSVPDGYCGCTLHVLRGAACGYTAEAKKCKNPGYCTLFGLCDGKNKPDGTDCHTGDPKFCDAFACKDGTCVDTPVPDQPLGSAGDQAAGAGNSGFKAQFALNDIAEKIGGTLKAFGAPLVIKPILNLGDQTTLICCESKKQLNVKTREQSVSGGLNLSTQEFPVFSPVPPNPPLGINIPRLGFQGVYAKLDGDLVATIILREDQCLDTSCFKGGGSVGITGTVGIKLGQEQGGILHVLLSGSTGVTGSLIAGCGSLKSTISFSGMQANAQITFTDYFNTTVSAQVLAGTVSEYEYKF